MAFVFHCVTITEEKLEKSPERDRSRSRGRDTETNACVFWKMWPRNLPGWIWEL